MSIPGDQSEGQAELEELWDLGALLCLGTCSKGSLPPGTLTWHDLNGSCAWLQHVLGPLTNLSQQSGSLHFQQQTTDVVNLVGIADTVDFKKQQMGAAHHQGIADNYSGLQEADHHGSGTSSREWANCSRQAWIKIFYTSMNWILCDFDDYLFIYSDLFIFFCMIFVTLMPFVPVSFFWYSVWFGWLYLWFSVIFFIFLYDFCELLCHFIWSVIYLVWYRG